MNKSGKRKDSFAMARPRRYLAPKFSLAGEGDGACFPKESFERVDFLNPKSFINTH